MNNFFKIQIHKNENWMIKFLIYQNILWQKYQKEKCPYFYQTRIFLQIRLLIKTNIFTFFIKNNIIFFIILKKKESSKTNIISNKTFFQYNSYFTFCSKIISFSKNMTFLGISSDLLCTSEVFYDSHKAVSGKVFYNWRNTQFSKITIMPNKDLVLWIIYLH